MDESEFEFSDPFLAISDYSENEKAIQDINAFLNAPSSVVVKKKSNNQIDQIKNPSTSVINKPTTNTNLTTSNNLNQSSSPKKGSIQFESSVFELPSFESDETSESKNEFKANESIKIINDFNPSQNNRNINKSSSNASNSDRKKDIKRTPYPNLISNQELMNAFLASDNTNNNNIDNKISKPEEKPSKDIIQNSKMEKKPDISSENANKETKKEIEDKITKPINNKKNENNNQKNKSTLDFLAKLDLDTTEVDADKNESHSLKKDPEPYFHQNSFSITKPKEKRRQFYYISPKSPIEAFEYSFLCYLEDASDDLRIRFSEEFQAIVEENFNFHKNIQDFLLTLKQELRTIIEDETSTLDLNHNHIEYDTDYISTFFQSLSSFLTIPNIQLPNTDNLKFNLNSPPTENTITPQIFDLNDISINADLIQSFSSSFITNSKSILSELQNNLTELSNMQPDFKRAGEVRIQGIYKQMIQKRLDLEAQERNISIERDYINQRLENLNRKNNIKINNDFFSQSYSPQINGTFSSGLENLPNPDELNDEIDEVIENLKNFDSKKVTSPLTSFSQKVKIVADDLLVLNTQLSKKARMVSRTLPLGNKNNFMPSAVQPSNIMRMNLPYYHSNFDFSEYSYQDQISNEFGESRINNDYFMNGNSKVANNVRERLANAKQLREDQIAEVHELISDNQ